MIVVYVILAALAGLIAVLFINTAIKCACARKLQGPMPEFT